MRKFIIVLSILLCSCKAAQMSTKKSDTNIDVDNHHKKMMVNVKADKYINKKHPSYKYYTKVENPVDNTLKNKKDLKRTNQSNSYKKHQSKYLADLNKKPQSNKNTRIFHFY